MSSSTTAASTQIAIAIADRPPARGRSRSHSSPPLYLNRISLCPVRCCMAASRRRSARRTHRRQTRRTRTDGPSLSRVSMTRISAVLLKRLHSSCMRALFLLVEVCISNSHSMLKKPKPAFFAHSHTPCHSFIDTQSDRKATI